MNLHTGNLLNKVPVTKVSNGIQILLSIKEFMLEEKFTNMENHARAQTLLNMQQFSLEKTLINVHECGKSFRHSSKLIGHQSPDWRVSL